MCKVYGYARISRKEQSIERQIRNIQAEYPDAVIRKEAFTGTKLEGRKELDRILTAVKPGDTIVFDSVSRMSRNAKEGFELYQRLYNNGVELVFLKEHYIDTATYRNALASGVPMTGTDVDLILTGVNQYLMKLAENQIRIAFDQAEKEVTDLHERTKEGIREVKRRNELIEAGMMQGEIKQIGQQAGRKLNVKKATPAKEIIRKRSKDFEGNLPDTEVMKITGLARNTYYKYKREMKQG